MAGKHPYSPSPGYITATINQFRSSFPAKVNAETLQQLGLAPKNESYVINVLRFIGAIDKDGNPTEKALTAFSCQGDPEFQKGFEELLRAAYSDLFALHRDATWDLPTDRLVSFFRTKDRTSALVGRLQAQTFQLLAGFAGHGALPAAPAPKPAATKTKRKTVEPIEVKTGDRQWEGGSSQARELGLTVRIEVNLPPAGDQETYDRIFRSIRENLLNAKRP